MEYRPILDKANSDLENPNNEAICEEPWIDLVKCKTLAAVVPYSFTYYFFCILSLPWQKKKFIKILECLSPIILISFPIALWFQISLIFLCRFLWKDLIILWSEQSVSKHKSRCKMFINSINIIFNLSILLPSLEKWK